MDAASDSYISSDFISLETFDDHLNALDRSGIEQIRLIGGEPTLHPQFPEILRQTQIRDKPVVIFSNGLITERVLTCIEELPPESCTVLVNMNATRTKNSLTETEQNIRYQTVRRLGKRTLLGFNIFRPNFQLDFLIDIIREADCRKAVRLGLSHPSLSVSNEYLHPKQYPIVGAKIAKFALVAAEEGIRLEFDCGFVRCMFSDENIASLIETNADFGWRCNPILDIDVTGRVLYCFPLANRFWTNLTENTNISTIRSKLGSWVKPYRLAGIYRECSTCLFKLKGECMGGCMANTLRRFHQASVRFVVPNNPAQQGYS